MNNPLNCKTPQEILKTVFGFESFRPLQLNVIQSVLEGNDTIAIMPTGGGKSLCYEIPSLILSGITIVISPLISLMQDQARQLEEHGIQVACLNSTLEYETYLQYCKKIMEGKIKLLYISPEGLTSGRVLNLLKRPGLSVSCIAVDEAHCISQWGHDFRPDYMEIAKIRKQFPASVFLALTATATKQVQIDIARNLKMKKPNIIVGSFNRENIFLQVEKKTNPTEQVLNFIERHPGQSGIIYCFSRKEVDNLTYDLCSNGIKALSYHAGLSDSLRSKNQKDFISGKGNVMVATVAFGMGINKRDVRYVIHFDLPKSIEQYYQEIGRAGRDGKQSEALLLYNFGDISKIKFILKDNESSSQAENLLEEMIQYSKNTVCRRKTLLSYFGEVYPSKNEKPVPSSCCCDICSEKIIDYSTPRIKSQNQSYILHKKGGVKTTMTEEENKIAEKLRAWRKREAEEENIPAYYIFNDKTLFDIARKKPSSIRELKTCYGIGDQKAQKFGKIIIRTLKEI